MKKAKKNTDDILKKGDVLASCHRELDEGAELLRSLYPHETTESLRGRVAGMLGERWRRGHWPAHEELVARREWERAVEAKAEASDETIVLIMD
jgi:hypothetical protein